MIPVNSSSSYHGGRLPVARRDRILFPSVGDRHRRIPAPSRHRAILMTAPQEIPKKFPIDKGHPI
jgi:hypothetical protein